MFLSNSKKMRETDEKSRILLTDLVMAVQDEEVVQDPEFMKLLSNALDQAEKKVLSAKADQAKLDHKPKDVVNP